MKLQSSKVVILAAGSLLVGAAFAGKYGEVSDEFEGTKSTIYKSTRIEQVKGFGIAYVLRDYDAADGTVLLIVSAIQKPLFADCRSYMLKVKTAEGVIHEVQAGMPSADAKTCIARIPADWIKNSFTVRLPLQGGQSTMATFPTDDLVLENIAKK
jgi:hypothetical protein